MASTIPGDLADHPARAAAIRSMAAVEAKDKVAWLAGFDDDAVLQDPVGVSPLDESGLGHHGKDAIAAFWEMTIAPNQIAFDIQQSFAGGDECANVGSITTTLDNGARVRTEGVFVYRVAPDGRLVSLRAFWEFDKMQFLG